MSQRGAFILNSVGHKQLTTIVQRYTAGTGTNSSTVYIPIANSWESAGAVGTYGWWGGGLAPAPAKYSIVDRIDFSNDSQTASVRGPLTSVRYGLAAAGNANYGWFAGGQPGPVSTVDRIDYANDSPTTASLRGPISSARSTTGASNANYAWWSGGSTSQVDRTDFSNDSPASASIRGPLSVVLSGHQAAVNANYAWLGGGTTPSPGVSTLNFPSNDWYSFQG
jgi:hypothetical protein